MAELFYFTATIIGFLVIVIKKNKSLFLLYIFVFSLPFFGLMYDIGIQINLDRIWALFMFLFMLHKLKIQKKLLKNAKLLLYKNDNMHKIKNKK